MVARVAVLASGAGSNLQAIIDAVAEQRLTAEIVAVVSNRPDSGALVRAERAGIPAIALSRRRQEPRGEYDRRLADIVAATGAELVVLAGWMRILTMAFLGRFPDAVINLHPARPGELPGVDAIERAFAEARAGTRTSTGVMVHRVPDEGIDDGPVLATIDVPILATDTLDTFTARVHTAEHALLVDVLVSLVPEGIR
jgi:phosphoribosylglycinamide formyltransferase 1